MHMVGAWGGHSLRSYSFYACFYHIPQIAMMDEIYVSVCIMIIQYQYGEFAYTPDEIQLKILSTLSERVSCIHAMSRRSIQIEGERSDSILINHRHLLCIITIHSLYEIYKYITHNLFTIYHMVFSSVPVLMTFIFFGRILKHVR